MGGLMTDQPSQPPRRIIREAGQNGPYPAIASPSGQQFQVMSLTLRCEPGLHVSGASPDSDDEGGSTARQETDKLSSGDVKFKATVQFIGDTGWKIGWVQTAEPSGSWVVYRQPPNSFRHQRTLQGRMKDGDSEGCWYGDEARKEADPATAVTVSMGDDPNISFCFPRHPGGPGLEDLKGKLPIQCGGKKEFWTWLVAVREDGAQQPTEVVFLHHVHWNVVYDCELPRGIGRPKPEAPDTSGAYIIEQGAGQGGATPVLAGPPPRPPNEDSKVEPVQ